MASTSLKHTDALLKEQFKTFSDAKEHFGLKAHSWKALADKLNAPSVNEQKSQLATFKEQFKSFSDAKQHFGLKANSWQALADKLNAPSVDDLKTQLATLEAQIAKLEAENKQLRAHAATGMGFDEVGFWLLDRNFEKAKFEDFGIPEAATEMESQAQAAYKSLAQKYHPDNGGLDEQMQNLNRLRNQMLAIVKLNGGIGL